MSLSQAQGIVKNVKAFYNRFEKYLADKAFENNNISTDKMDQDQVANYDLAWIAAEIFAIDEMIAYPAKVEKGAGSIEENLSLFFIADALNDIVARFRLAAHKMGITSEQAEKELGTKDIYDFIAKFSSEEFAGKISDTLASTRDYGAYGLNDDQAMMADTFRKFAEGQVKPIAEKVHRQDLTIPDEIIDGLAEMGCFGLSIADTYGGFQSEANPDHTSMAVVTEELSRGSVGVAGSLITRPEIVAKAIAAGGTEEQKQKWLPLLASGEKKCAVAVTEPDFGSDVAGMKVAAVKVDGGWKINGVKTWCTFAGMADVLLVLVRTNPDMSLKHRGLSILLAEKAPTRDHEFDYTQPEGGRMHGKAISTIGYRGMHSYEVVFEDYFVPDANLVGGEAGLGKGFYLQMAGFAGGRLQTAARATGVMQAAVEKALQYAMDRKIFGKPIAAYGINRHKIAKMAAITQAVRQMTYKSARLMDKHEGQMEASLVKFYSCRIAEWVTREALQIHGGMGYAEEYEVSRLFVDARVFSIFEGAEEVLALRVIARALLARALGLKAA
ncbi:acyl-CoA dehydrogenase family protein [Turneriella parva]|uniref:Acyl-CoA dehydrogenase domain-containing protein n=1 Tax=Turneriella parva (strain ATCC BAA-1111 / DSM 21527 / NCTC 11395 / H) TaxID=869212 RepID=I4BBF7_TURPD|nr:acyl-CoA dehydrogenase family protein [Turneriella parva]AFM14614.1 acyl-CoA dehydrogenase domain-containing protein [Turneriella parva DSM 21527]